MKQLSRMDMIADEDRVMVERYCEARASAIPLGPDKLLCRVLGERLLYVDPSDTTLTPHLAMSGYWEIWITQAIARHVKPGMVCVDVGANCGYFTTLMAELVGADGRVYAAEPQESLCHLMRLSAMANGYQDRTTIWQHALGDESREVEMFVDPTERGNASVRSAGGTVVHQVTLDTMLDFVSALRLDFIKIDAEGSEPRIWTGMQEALKRYNPTVLMEYAGAMYPHNPGWLRQSLADYRVRSVEDNASLRERTFDEIEASPPGQLWMLWIDRPNS